MASNACGAPQSIMLVGDVSPSPSFTHIRDMRLRVSAKHFHEYLRRFTTEFSDDSCRYGQSAVRPIPNSAARFPWQSEAPAFRRGTFCIRDKVRLSLSEAQHILRSVQKPWESFLRQGHQTLSWLLCEWQFPAHAAPRTWATNSISLMLRRELGRPIRFLILGIDFSCFRVLDDMGL